MRVIKANRNGTEKRPKGPRFLAIFLLSLAACGPGRPEASDAESGPDDFSRRDSAGVDISTTSGTTAWAPLPWDVDSLPDLMIGHGESLGGL